VKSTKKRTTFAPVTSMRYTRDGVQVVALGSADRGTVKPKAAPRRRKLKP
jgi:hypothetical protein